MMIGEGNVFYTIHRVFSGILENLKSKFSVNGKTLNLTA